MSVKVHFLHSHLDYFPENLGAVSEEQGECFHQDIKEMERRYQRRWDVNMMADYCWMLKRENSQEHSRKTSIGAKSEAQKHQQMTRISEEILFTFECVSTSLLPLWAESQAQGTGEYFPPLQFHAEIVDVEIGGVAIYHSFGEFRRAKLYCHLYGAKGQ
ncbi:uncharacterized protein TNCV_2827061 [Trichonephila clavipes]|nr:uncharacterized protein TNCV_2827061 [Trichonephila clavipes]